jgi:hypothetical protein
VDYPPQGTAPYPVGNLVLTASMASTPAGDPKVFATYPNALAI